MKTLLTTLAIGSFTIAQAGAAVILNAGKIDNLQEFTGAGGGTGPGTGGVDVRFIQEIGGATPLPGSATDIGGEGAGRVVDDDYYFAGTYTTQVDGGPVYSPLAIVGANEANMERAWTMGDPNLRFHFNLPASTQPTDLFTISFGITNGFDLGDPADAVAAVGWKIDTKMNGNLIFSQDVLPGDLNGDWTSPAFTLADVGNPGVGAGPDNYIELTGTSLGTSRWLSLDYVQLESTSAVPEPSTGLLVLLGGLALVPILRRRRSR